MNREEIAKEVDSILAKWKMPDSWKLAEKITMTEAIADYILEREKKIRDEASIKGYPYCLRVCPGLKKARVEVAKRIENMPDSYHDSCSMGYQSGYMKKASQVFKECDKIKKENS